MCVLPADGEYDVRNLLEKKYVAFQAKAIIKLERNLIDLNAYYQLINSCAKILCKFMAEQGVVLTVEGIVHC